MITNWDFVKNKMTLACDILRSGLFTWTLFDSYIFFLFFLLIIKFDMRQRLAESFLLFFEILFWCKDKMFFRRERKREREIKYFKWSYCFLSSRTRLLKKTLWRKWLKSLSSFTVKRWEEIYWKFFSRSAWLFSYRKTS